MAGLAPPAWSKDLALAAMERAGRFGFFATLTPPDVKGSLEELGHAMDNSVPTASSCSPTPPGPILATLLCLLLAEHFRENVYIAPSGLFSQAQLRFCLEPNLGENERSCKGDGRGG